MDVGLCAIILNRRVPVLEWTNGRVLGFVSTLLQMEQGASHV